MWPHGHDPRWDRMQMQHPSSSSSTGSHLNNNNNNNNNININTNANMPGCLCNDWTNIPLASSSSTTTSQLQYPHHQTQNTLHHHHHHQHLQHHQQQQQQQQQKMGHVHQQVHPHPQVPVQQQQQHQQETQFASTTAAASSSSSTCNVTRMNTQWYTRPAATPNFFISDTPASNSREMRNRAEKLRRDKLNSYILQLATLVPMVSSSAKRMDKTSILRLTATHLRIYYTLLNGQKPKSEFNEVDWNALDNLIYEQLEGFLLILTPAGRIVFVSHTVEQLLGHLQTDLMGQSIYTITSTEDHEKLRVHLSLDIIDIEWRRYFNLNLAKAGPRTEAPTYEQFNVMGMIRPSNDNNKTTTTTTTSTATTTTTTSLKQQNVDAGQTASTNKNNLLVFFVKLYRPPALSDMLIEANKEEYITRHLIDGRIVNCDHRISFVAGYMIEEVSGLSAFKFMHREDVRWTMIGLRQMYDRGESVGWSCYRLRSRTGRFIYLRTLGYLEVDNTGLVESFVCVNTLVTEEEGKKLIREMKERYSVMINFSVTDQITENEMKNASVEDPHAVDECVKLLIKNIVPTSPKSEPSTTVTSPKPSALKSNESQDCYTLTELETPQPQPQPPSIPLLLNNGTTTTTTTTTIITTLKTKTKRLQNDNDDNDDRDILLNNGSTRKRQKRRTISSSSSTSTSSTSVVDLMLLNEYQQTSPPPSLQPLPPPPPPPQLSSSTSPLQPTSPAEANILLQHRPNLNNRRHNDQSSVYQSHNLLNNLGM